MDNFTDLLLNNGTDLPSKQPTFVMVIVTTGIPLATLIANLPSIVFVIWMTVRKKNAKNIHLVSIGITDALVGLFGYLMAEAFNNRNRHFSFYNCYFRYYLFSVTFVASLLHVLGICVQRLRILISGLKAQQQRLLEWTVILVSWVLSAIVNTFIFVFLTTSKVDLKECSIDSLVQGKEYIFFKFIGWTYATIVFLVAVAMCTLLCLLWIRKRTLPGNQVAPKDVKLCITVTVMAIIFLAGTLPLTVILLRNENLGETRRQQRAVCIIISLLNSLINPFIYMLRSNNLKIICRKTNAVANINNARVSKQKQRSYTEEITLESVKRKNESMSPSDNQKPLTRVLTAN